MVFTNEHVSEIESAPSLFARSSKNTVLAARWGKTSGYGGPLRGNGDASLNAAENDFPIEI